MKMKKILLVILTLFVFILINIIISTSSSYLAYVKEIRFKHDIFPSENAKFKIVGIGNSHARDSLLFYENTGINLGLSAQSIELNLLILKKYEKYFSEEATIYYELTYSSFEYDFSGSKKHYLDLGFYYNELGISFEDYLINNYFPLIGIESSLFFMEYITNKNPQHFADVMNEFEDEESLIENANDYFQSTYLNSYSKKNSIIAKNIQILIETIIWAKQSNFNLVFYTAPHFKPLAERTNNEIPIVNTFNEIILNLEINYDINYHNLNYLSQISDNYKYFRNANHLNYDGALIFTDYLISL